MKLSKQEAVLNHGNEAEDWLPASLLHVLCPSTQPSPASWFRGKFSLLAISCRSRSVSEQSPRTPHRELSSQQLAADCLVHLCGW